MFSNVLNLKSLATRKLIELIGGPEYLTIQIDITNACNLNCTHCYHKDHKNQGAASFQDWCEIIDQYENLLRKLNTKASFVICGGEPLLSKTFKPIIERIRSKWAKAPISVLTNGTLLSEKNIIFLKENSIDLQVSLDGPNAELHDKKRGKGNFDKSIEGVKRALDSNLKVHFLGILSKQTAPWIPDFFEMAKELKVYSMNFTRFIPVGQGEKLINSGSDEPLKGHDLRDAYVSILKNSRLSGVHTNTNKPLFCLIDDSLGASAKFGFQGIVVDYRGNLKVSSRTNHILGNVINEGLENLFLRHPLMKQFRKGEIQGCSKCEHLSKCGGDRNVSFADTGSYLGFDHGCWKPEFQHLKGEDNEIEKIDSIVVGHLAN